MKKHITTPLIILSILASYLTQNVTILANETMEKNLSYYKEYESIINTLQERYHTNENQYNWDDIHLVPFEELEKEDFINPEEFKQVAYDFVTDNYEVSSYTSYIPGVKTATIKTTTKTFYLDIVPQFSLTYPLTSTYNRRLFYNLDDIVVQCRNSSASWKQTGYGFTWLDGKLTCSLTFQGILRYGAMEFGLLDASTEFYYSSDGKIY